MSAHWKVLQTLLIAVLWTGGCEAQEQRVAPAEKSKAAASGAGTAAGNTGTSKSVDSPSKTVPPEKEKRANTPPGMDRAGDGPAAGAIVDPSGVTTPTRR
jgi:hypothetical protein